MTIIEFFAKAAIENMASVLLCAPDKVIFVGDNSKRMKRAIALYEEVAAGRGLQVEFAYKAASRNNLNQIVAALSDIIETNGECVLDLDGGEDLFLVAVGMVAEKYKGKIQLHRYNVHSNSLLDCDADGNVLWTAPKEISIEENIRIYGGRVIFSGEKGEATRTWDLNEEFLKDVKAMWEICKKNPAFWNTQINTLDRVDGVLYTEDPLDVVVDKETLSKLGSKLRLQSGGVLDALYEKGLVKNLEVRDDYLAFSYKNEQVKRCLTKAGQVLEMYINVLAREIKDEEGKPVYNDVMTGVYIDWDGYVEDDADVSNEIDVLLMKGLVPVFISCKNGSVKVDELYKLSTVANRFGSKYAKKVLIVSDLAKMGTSAEYIRERAKDMNIRIIENMDNLSEAELCKMLKALWCN